MSKKKSKNPVVIDSMIIWNAQKPKFNGWAGGYGPHGKSKYNRKQKHKDNWKDWD